MAILTLYHPNHNIRHHLKHHVSLGKPVVLSGDVKRVLFQTKGDETAPSKGDSNGSVPQILRCKSSQSGAYRYKITHIQIPTLCGIPSVMIFYKAVLICSPGHWADTAATVQPKR